MQPAFESHRSRTRGFTIVELLVVIAMLVIVMSVSAPRIFKSLHMSSLRGEANNLMATLKFCQGMAAMQRAPYTVHFNLDSQTYYVTREAARGDDFEFTGTQLGSGTSSLFPGEELRYLPDDPYSEAAGAEGGVWDEEGSIWDDGTSSSNRGGAGPVNIFDEDRHEVPVGVVIEKIIDGRGEEITSGEFALPLTPQGRAIHTEVYITTTRGTDPHYVVTMQANGLARIDVKERDEI